MGDDMVDSTPPEPVARVEQVVLYQPVCDGPHMLAGAWSGPSFSFKSEAERWAKAHDESEHPLWLRTEPNGRPTDA